MMKLRIVKVLCVLFLGLGALPVKAQDWTGFYIGAGVSDHSGTNTDYSNGTAVAPTPTVENPYKRSGAMRSLHFGYRLQSRAMVYGAELSFANGALRRLASNSDNHIPQYTNVLGKVGYAYDRVLLSVGFGAFEGSLRPKCIDACGVADLSGLVLSIGVDTYLTDRVTLGASVMRRSFSHETYELLPASFTTSGHDTGLELRLGCNF